MQTYAIFREAYGRRAIEPGAVLCGHDLAQAVRVRAGGAWEPIEIPYDAAVVTCVVCGING